MKSGWPWGFNRSGTTYCIDIPPRKLSGRSKVLKFGIGRPPEYCDLAECLRALNCSYKLLASVSRARLASIQKEEAIRILQDAGVADERFLIRTADHYGGTSQWHALRSRYRNPALNMASIRAEAERIIAQQQPRGDLVQLLTGGLRQLERNYYGAITDVIDQPTRNYLFSSGSKDDLKTSLNACIHHSLGGNQQHVNLLLDLRSPHLQQSFNRDTDIVVIHDGRSAMELVGGYFNRLYQLQSIVPNVNVLTFMFHQYIDNLIDTKTDWCGNVEAQVLSRILPPGGRIHRMKYGTISNRLELKSLYYATDIAAACEYRSGFIWHIYDNRMQSGKSKKRRSRV